MNTIDTKSLQIFEDMKSGLYERGYRIVSIDIATTGEDRLKDKITSIAIGAPDHTPLVIDLTQPRPEEIGNPLKQLLDGPSEKVFYDGKRAINFFHSLDITVSGPIYDVMLADKILRAGLGYKNRTFKDIVMEYLGAAVDIDSTLSPITNASALLLKLRETMIPILQENSLMDTAALEFECIPAVAEMERNGIRIDVKKLMEVLQELTRQKVSFKEDVQKEMGNINLNSHKQVKEALNKRGIVVNDTKQATLFPFFMPHLWIWNYLVYKEIAYDSSVANGLLTRVNSNTGRVYPKYSQIGAPTGRFSCSDPNLHAMPREEKFRYVSFQMRVISS
jgi:DNA polymerase I-like protein with 3'-5' exonuclease and polymerase domains